MKRGGGVRRVIEPCVTIVRESERQRGPHMVAARCLCAPRVCGVLVACAGMARCMFVIAFAVCVFHCAGTSTVLWYTCDMSSGRRLSCATWARGSVVSIRVGRERDLERPGCGEGTGDQGSACTTGTAEIGFTQYDRRDASDERAIVCYVLQEGVPLKNSVIDHAVNTILCNSAQDRERAKSTDVLHDLFASKRRQTHKPLRRMAWMPLDDFRCASGL